MPTFPGSREKEYAITGTQKVDAHIKCADMIIGAVSAKARNTTLSTAPQDTMKTDTIFPLPRDIVSPVNRLRLSNLLSSHPDQELVHYINDGFRDGFDIMYCGNISSTLPKNLKSAMQYEQKVTAAITKELQRGHTSGPFELSPFSITHCSPLGAVEKQDSSVRIILDLSQPRGASVNESIIDDYCSVHYTSFDEAVRLVKTQGAKAFMAKVDIRHAFRLCPVRRADWPLLCYFWKGKYYVDTRLPFGARSSPAIFNTFADVLTWILSYHGEIDFIVHYLDDFLICAPDKETCTSWLCTFQDIMKYLGVPVAHDKTVPPSSVLVFLGIEIDVQHQMIRLPNDKLNCLLSTLNAWSNRKKCTKRELLSLVGSLAFASKVVKSGRTFVRRLIDLAYSVSRLGHHISLNRNARADIQWWIDFLPSWNGIELIQHDLRTSSDLSLFTDASDIGMGGVFDDKWFSTTWPLHFSGDNCSTNFQELFAIFTAITIWADMLSNKQILIHCDNQTIVSVINAGTCKSSTTIMTVIRKLFFVCARHNISILAKHIPGHFNDQADALSRLQVARFNHLHPTAAKNPTSVPATIWNI